MWLLGTSTITPSTRNVHSNTIVTVMAFTPMPPTTSTTSYFTAQQQQQQQQQQQPHFTDFVDSPNPQHASSSTSLHGTATSMMSPWNINPEFGAPPFGFDMNAEIWNGRIAQVRLRNDDTISMIS